MRRSRHVRPDRRPSPVRGARLLALPLALALAAGAPAALAQDPASPGAVVPVTPLTVGLGYIPSVQFAQFYYADQAGYYADAGLDVTFRNQIDPDLITLIGTGAVDIGMGDGTSIVPARSQGIPVRYAATIYARFPGVVFAKASSGIETPADLAGRSIGTPGRYGTNWVMLQALLSSAGLTADDVTIALYPTFGQGDAVAIGQVDAATGFANNEPVVLALGGEEVTVLRVDDIVPLPGPGLVVSDETLETRREVLRAFVAATLRAMAEIAADPQLGLDATFARVPELASDPRKQRAILEATIEGWSNPYTEAHGLGAVDPEAWARTVDFLVSMPDSPVAGPVPVEDLITTELLPSPEPSPSA
jgi:NitT/TauT family transport system substrate-binding protein